MNYKTGFVGATVPGRPFTENKNLKNNNNNKKSNNYNKFFIITAVALIFIFINSVPSHAIDVYVTSPWLAMMTRFIGGVHVTVRPMKAWTESGAVVSRSRPKTGALVIAIDEQDASSSGVLSSNYKLRTLYKTLPFKGAKPESVFFDPAALPFLSQRLLIVISAADRENYPYYQRRLAEFQSRMESSLEVARNSLEKSNMLDLSGLCAPWIRSAAPLAVRPPEELFEQWGKGQNLSSLSAAISEAAMRNWLVIVDPWTPPSIRVAAAAAKNAVHIAPPSADKELFDFFYEVYLAVWNKIL